MKTPQIIVAAIAISFATILPASAAGPQQPQQLTGDSKLACEAIICLSTSTRPSECNSALQKYFSLKPKKRPGFLQQCPKG